MGSGLESLYDSISADTSRRSSQMILAESIKIIFRDPIQRIISLFKRKTFLQVFFVMILNKGWS